MGDLRRCVGCEDKVSTRNWEKHSKKTMKSEKIDADSVVHVLGKGIVGFGDCMGYRTWMWKDRCYKYSERYSGVAERHDGTKGRDKYPLLSQRNISLSPFSAISITSHLSAGSPAQVSLSIGSHIPAYHSHPNREHL